MYKLRIYNVKSYSNVFLLIKTKIETIHDSLFFRYLLFVEIKQFSCVSLERNLSLFGY